MIEDLLHAAAGGILIGLSAGLFYLLNGRIAGISGLVGGLLRGEVVRRLENIAFIIGLPLGLGLMVMISDTEIPANLAQSPGQLIVAGLLVGYGSRLANGCTSGHAVCGLARFSKRSMVATAVFMTVAILTVALLRM